MTHFLLPVATRFLTEAGVLLHYSQPLHGLNTLYFIDPSWLAQLLAKFISVDVSSNFVCTQKVKKVNKFTVVVVVGIVVVIV